MRKPFFLLLLLAPAAANAVLIDKIVATVNSELVLRSDVNRFQDTLSLRRELDPLFGVDPELSKSGFSQKATIDFLVQEELILQAFKPQDSDVEAEIQAVQKNTNLGREELVQFLRSKGFSFDEYFELMRVGVAKRRLLDQEVRSRVNITDEDIKNYSYSSASNDERKTSEYRISLIIAPSEAAAKNALKAVQEGEDFSEVAKRFPASRDNGGDIGFVDLSQISETLRNAVKKLKKIDDISPVIASSNAFFIVKLTDLRVSATKGRDEAKERVRDKLAREEYKKQIDLWAERARNDAYVHVNEAN